MKIEVELGIEDSAQLSELRQILTQFDDTQNAFRLEIISALTNQIAVSSQGRSRMSPAVRTESLAADLSHPPAFVREVVSTFLWLRCRTAFLWGEHKAFFRAAIKRAKSIGQNSNSTIAPVRRLLGRLKRRVASITKKVGF